jgi:hypothetical protein
MSATVSINLSTLSRLPPPPSPHRQVPIQKEEGRSGSGEKVTPVRLNDESASDEDCAHLGHSSLPPSLSSSPRITFRQMVVLTSPHSTPLPFREIKMMDHRASARRDRQISLYAQVIAAAPSEEPRVEWRLCEARREVAREGGGVCQ